MRAPTVAAVFALTLLPPVWAAGQDFRVETDVFVAKNKEPVAQYLTVFKAGAVYDFMLDGPEEVTVYHVKSGRFLLFDTQQSIQTTVTLDELRQLTADIKVEAQNAGDENVRFLANPEFEVTLDAQQRRVTLASKRLNYSALGLVPPEPGVVRRYTDFADGYARMNGLRLGNMPPFARLQLNEQLAAQGWVPQEVKRTIPKQVVLGNDIEVRSRHLFSWKVLPTDEDRMARADRLMTTLKVVSIAEYFKWPKRVAKAQ